MNVAEHFRQISTIYSAPFGFSFMPIMLLSLKPICHHYLHNTTGIFNGVGGNGGQGFDLVRLAPSKKCTQAIAIEGKRRLREAYALTIQEE